jgi:hypothetical protein
MAQIKTGTVNLTNGSNAVVGIDTSWLGAVQPGWIFVSADTLIYFVASVSDNTHLTLTAPYAGATTLDTTYGIVTGYSPLLSLPLVGINDMDAAAIISKALCMLEQATVAAQNGIVFKGSWNAATNSPAIPTAASGNANWEYVVSVAGTSSINGIATWNVGDLLVSNGAIWTRIAAPISSGSGTSGPGNYVVADTLNGKNYQIVTANGIPAAVEMAPGTGTPQTLIVMDTTNGSQYQIITKNGIIDTEGL